MESHVKITFLLFFSEQSHQDLKIQSPDIPASQLVRAVSATCKFLFFMPSHLTSKLSLY